MLEVQNQAEALQNHNPSLTWLLRSKTPNAMAGLFHTVQNDQDELCGMLFLRQDPECCLEPHKIFPPFQILPNQLGT